MGAWVAFLERE